MSDLPLMPSQFGTVHTIIRRNEPVTFEMQILARLVGGGPSGTDAILGRASGRVIDELGGIAQGMSGSPVVVGGKVIGAVAFGYENDLTLALITPLEEMLKIEPSDGGGEPDVGMAPGLPPIQPTLPLSCGGFRSSRALKYLERRLERSIAPGFSSPPDPDGPEPPLQPGAAVAAALVTGDVQIGSIGTVTATKKGLVWAFGHAFLFLGPVELPLMTADILETTHGHPPHAPIRLGRMRKVVGTVLQDRPVAIVGRLGDGPRLVPVTFTVTDGDSGAEMSLAVQVVRHAVLLADLVAGAGLEAYDRGLNRKGGGTATVRFTVRSSSLGRPVEREETIYSADDIATDALQPLVGILRAMTREHFPIDEVLCETRVDRQKRTASLGTALLEEEGRILPGESLPVTVTVQPHGDKPRTLSLNLDVPIDFPLGLAELRVIPGRHLNVSLSDAHTPEEMEAAIAGRPADHDLVVALIPALPGAYPLAASFRTEWVLEGDQLVLPTVVIAPWP